MVKIIFTIYYMVIHIISALQTESFYVIHFFSFKRTKSTNEMFRLKKPSSVESKPASVKFK